MNGPPNEWTNPSKCLVDKALEGWSTTKMRADNTSVVIIMLDPPGPPKRDVLKTCPSQMILETDEMEQQPLTEDKTFAMHDYCTKETVELNNIPSMLTSGVSGGINRYETTVGYAHASTSSGMDVGFANSFAESYNSLLNANIGNDHAYTYQTHETLETHHSSNTCSDDTYSLTKLETRMEQIASSSSPAMLFTDYQQNHQRYDERHQYDCITSSFLSLSSCQLLNLEDSIQAVVIDVVEETAQLSRSSESHQGYPNEFIDDRMQMDSIPCELHDQPTASTSYECSHASLCSQMPSTSSVMTDDCVTNDTLASTSTMDESIQINEISSSSKEKKEKFSSSCAEKLTRSKTKHKLNEGRRVTRSNVLKPSDNGVSKRTMLRDTISKNVRTIGKKQSTVQNENVVIVPTRSLRRTTIADPIKRSLRSDDITSGRRTSPTKAKQQTLHKRNTGQSMATSSLNNVPSSQTLREKVKPNQQQTNAKPKNISKVDGKRVSSNAQRQTTISKLYRSKRLNR